jgi:hypothetical protein
MPKQLEIVSTDAYKEIVETVPPFVCTSSTSIFSGLVFFLTLFEQVQQQRYSIVQQPLSLFSIFKLFNLCAFSCDTSESQKF